MSASELATSGLSAAPRHESALRQTLGALVSAVLAVSMAGFGVTGFALIVLGAWWAATHLPGAHLAGALFGNA